MTVALAGHPPPAIAFPGRRTVLAELNVDPPLGVGWTVQRASTKVDFEPGSLMAFYTDGLVERRGEAIDLGLERLCDVVSSDRPDAVARDVLHELVGDSTPDDDIALLVIRRTDDLLSARATAAVALSTQPSSAVPS
jgi:serine phosphatase RsbU (regulator of sigma subunit)